MMLDPPPDVVLDHARRLRDTSDAIGSAFADGRSVFLLTREDGFRLVLSLHPVASRPSLTVRQRVILDLTASGLQNAAIGRELRITTSTVKHHVQEIMDSTTRHSRTALTRFLYESFLTRLAPGAEDDAVQIVRSLMHDLINGVGDALQNTFGARSSIALGVDAAFCALASLELYDPDDALTPAEVAVVDLLGYEHGDAGIARVLGQSLCDVKRLIRAAVRRRRVINRTALLRERLLDRLDGEEGNSP